MAASTDGKAKGGGCTPLIPSRHGFSVANAAVAAAEEEAEAAAVPAVALPPNNGVALVEAVASVAALVAALAATTKDGVANGLSPRPLVEGAASAVGAVTARAGPLDAGNNAAAVQVAGHWVVGEPHVQTLEALADQT